MRGAGCAQLPPGVRGVDPAGGQPNAGSGLAYFGIRYNLDLLKVYFSKNISLSYMSII